MNLKASDNLEYKLHNENKSDYDGDDQEKRSYISVKLQPKILDSNLSSPTPEEREKKKQGAHFSKEISNEIFKYKEFSNNLINKPEKRIFEY